MAASLGAYKHKASETCLNVVATHLHLTYLAIIVVGIRPTPAARINMSAPHTVAANTFRLAMRLAIAALLATLAACGGGNELGAPPALSDAAKLGRQIFNDATLSASGRVACASCHLESQAFASTLAVNPGGPALELSGTRNAPSLTYLDLTPAFFFAKDGTPTGGFDRDGRVNSLIEQARLPFLSGNEMANESPASIVAKLKAAAYALEFKALFGSQIFEQGDAAFERALFALASFQREDPAFHPYSSKFDAVLAGTAVLTAQETRGLALYNNPLKGNCAACHPSTRGPDGSPPLFTDFSYDNLGVPRNADIPANRDASYFDLGLCGPARTDLAGRSDLCGAFKVPTLRNIEKTAPYFHNGRFATLVDALRFYVRRDTNPEQWYPRSADNTVNKFDDLPAAYQANVNTSEVPYNRQPGDQPALSEPDIADLVVFLKTLTDGYQP